MQPLSTELILIRVTGEDRPGLTASVTEILAKYDATILDIGQADIHNTLSLGILCKTEEQHSGFIMKELLFKASSLGVTIRFYPISVKEYEDWVNLDVLEMSVATSVKRIALSTYFCGTRLRVISVLQRIRLACLQRCLNALL